MSTFKHTPRGRAVAIAALVFSTPLTLSACTQGDSEPVDSSTQTPEPSVEPVGPSGDATGPSATQPGTESPSQGGSESSSQGGEPSLPSGPPSSFDPSEPAEPQEGQAGITDLGGESDQIAKAAEGYVQARENQMTADREEPTDWLDEARPFMAQKFYDQQRKAMGQGGPVGAQWELAHSEGLTVKAEVSECGLAGSSGVDKSDRKIIQCALANKILLDGKEVPVSKVPPQWFAVGPQTPPLLVVVKEDGKWVVGRDLTGQAS